MDLKCVNCDTQIRWLSQDCSSDHRVDQPAQDQEDPLHHRPQQGGPPLRVEVQPTQGHQGTHRHAGRLKSFILQNSWHFHS